MPKLNQRGVIAQVLVLLLLAAGLIGGLYLVSHPTFFKPKAANTGTRIEFSGSGVSADGTSTTSQTVSINAYYFVPSPTTTPAPTSIPPSNTYNTPSYNIPPYVPPAGIGSTAPVGVGGSVKGVGTTGPSFGTYPDSIKLSNSQAGLTQPCSVVNGVNVTCQTSYTSNPTIFAGWKLSDGSGSKTVYAQFLVNNQPLGLPVSANITYNPSTSSPAPSSSPGAARVFVTSTTYNGNLGGLSGADQKCQDRASAANLGGTWKAWLTDNTTTAASRLNHNTGPYKLLNGTVVANNWADLTDGTLQNAINITEFNQSKNSWGIWTNTQINGTLMNYGSTSCNNWQSSATGVYGGLGSNVNISTPVTNSYWTWNSSAACSSSYPLYCFEQTSATSAPTPSPTPAPVPTLSPSPISVTLTPPTNSPAQKASGAVSVTSEKGVGFFANYVRFNLSGTFSKLVSKANYQIFVCRKNNGSCNGGMATITDTQGNGKLPQGTTINMQGNPQDFNTVILIGPGCYKVTAPCLKGTF